jgi:DNA-binding transcriptional regulator YiaG
VSKTPSSWDAERVRRLRRRLALSQQAFARELGVRQQTVSEWETGIYEPRGASARVLSLVAERAEVQYGASPSEGPPGENTGDDGS